MSAPAPRRVAPREIFCFAAGDAGFNIVWQSIELYLLFFYIHGVGLTPAQAATIFIAGAIVDWTADPLIGLAADRHAARVSMRAWVLVGGPISCAALVLAFAQPVLAPDSGMGLALAFHLLLRLSYSVGNIPYGALTTRITDSIVMRTRLTGARMQGAAIGGISTGLVYAAVVSGADDRQAAPFAFAAAVLGLVALPLFLMTARGVTERVQPISESRSFGVVMIDLGRLLWRSPELRRILLTVIACGLSVTVLSKSILFLFEAQDEMRLGFVAALLPPLMLLISTPRWIELAARIGRVATLRVAMAGNLLVAVMLPLVIGSPLLCLFAIILAVLAGHGMSVMFWALLPDAVSAAEAARGGAFAARVYALASTARKLAQALAPALLAIGIGDSSVTQAEGAIALPFLIAALITALLVLAYPPRVDDDAVSPRKT